MSENLPKPANNASDEVDLGQLFKLIGDGFKKLFAFIGTVLKGVFTLLMSLLIFLQRNIIKLVIAGGVGLIFGFVLDYYKSPTYVSTMVVEPNFNSAQQLYNSVGFYNELAVARGSISLGEALDITPGEASAIKSFEIESYADENQKVRLFDQFVRSLDTSTQKTIDMEKFLANFNSFDARFHTVTIKAKNSTVARKAQPAILLSISRNAYFETQMNVAKQNFELQDQLLNAQLTEIDSLQRLYKRVMEKEAEKPMQGTSISLGESGKGDNKEIELLDQINFLKEAMVELKEEKANKSSILNIISDFPRRGVKEKGIMKSYKFLVPIAFLTITLIFLILMELNKFIIQYKGEHSKF